VSRRHELEIFDLDPATYEPHPLHGAGRNWTETNCWLDMMIELLHVLGLDPTAALAGSPEHRLRR
jgi:hypothetical protein